MGSSPIWLVYGALVKRSRHRSFEPESRVRLSHALLFIIIFSFIYSVYILKLSLLERRHMDMPKKFITLSVTFIKKLWHSTLVSYASLSGTI